MNEALMTEWLSLKEAEATIVGRRRHIEAEMEKNLGLDATFEGTKSLKEGDYLLKATRRFTRSVDGDKLQDVATKYGMDEYLPTLFRWKPEINKREWDKTSETVTKLLSEAITTKPGKTSFSITKEEI